MAQNDTLESTVCRACEGASLRLMHFRERRGISLATIAKKTKIGTRFLEAIEAGDYAKLPGGIFATSYLRQYAAETGFDEAGLLAHYRREAGIGEPEPEAVEVHESFLERWWRIATPGAHSHRL